MRRVTVALVAATVAAGFAGVGWAGPPGLPMHSQADSSCPAVKTCRAYVLEGYSWPHRLGKPVVIPYYVSTKLSNPWVPATELPKVVAAATAVWMKADPLVRFRYMGTTDALPGAPFDGKNVIGYGAPEGAPGAELADTATDFTSQGTIIETDISIDPTRPWSWTQCAQRDAGCAGHSTDLVKEPLSGDTWGPEIQGVLEHELGHALGLDHSDAKGGTEETMFSQQPAQNLAMQTLGLGDILGVRAIYPCGKCGGAPEVFAP